MYFVSYGALNMSSVEPAFDSIQSTIELVLLSVFQDIQFPEYSLTEYKKSSVLASIFFYLLFLVFNTFAMQFFIAILVFPFASLRARYQLSLEALETYESSISISSTTQLWCFLTFQMVEAKKADKSQAAFSKPQTSESKGVKKLNSTSDQEDKAKYAKSTSTADKEKDKQEDSSMLGWNKKKIIHILKSNIDFLIGKTSGSSSIVSRDNYIDKMEALIKEFSEKRKKAVDGKVREVTEGVFGNLLSSIVYFIYIVVFVSMLTTQLENSNNYDSLMAFTSYVEKNTFRYTNYSNLINFTEIKTLNEYRTWVNSVALSDPASVHLSTKRQREYQSKNFQRAVHYQQCFYRLP